MSKNILNYYSLINLQKNKEKNNIEAYLLLEIHRNYMLDKEVDVKKCKLICILIIIQQTKIQ